MADNQPNVKTKSPKGGHPIYWVLAIGLLAFLCWVWWDAGKKSPKENSVATQKSDEKETATTHRVSKLDPSELVSVGPARSNSAAAAVVTAPSSTNATVKMPVVPTTNLTSISTNTVVPPAPAGQFPRPVKTMLEAQIALVEQGISPGSLDGAIGSQTRSALAAYQHSQNLPITGELDAVTKQSLQLQDEPYTAYIVTPQDLARLQPIATTWVGKSEQTALDYETILELVSEASFSSPNLIRQLNPGINWGNVEPGTILQVPNAQFPDDSSKAAIVVIHLSARVLEAFDAQTNLLVHFPCSIAQRVEKRPVGELHVAVVAPDPNYTFDPDVFPESAEAKTIKRKLILPPGPNNPVGVAWIGLDKPGYGIHGTPAPEQVGRTESHGCFRLANWNAEYLLKLITIGTPVYVVE